MWAVLVNLFWSFVISAAIQAISPKQKPAGARRYSLSEFDFPTADETRPLGRVYGTVPLAMNVLAVGDYSASKVTRKVKTGWFSSTRQTVGYRYYIGMHGSLAGCVCDRVTAVYWGDRLAWSGNVALSRTSTPTELAVNFAFAESEGQQVLDGLAGTIRLWNQALPSGYSPLVQLATDSYVASLVGETPPAYPNTLHVVLQRCFVGSGPRIPALKLVVGRFPAAEELLAPAAMYRTVGYPFAGTLESVAAATQDWCKARSVVNNTGCNPAFALLDAMLCQDPGMGPRMSPYALDFDSFMRAADTLYAEGVGMSFEWAATQPTDELVEKILRVVNGQLEPDPRTGLLRLRLIREADEPVLLFNESNIVEMSRFTRVALPEAPNRVEVPYVEVGASLTTRTVAADNLAGVRVAGSLVVQKEEYLGIDNPALASRLATRQLRLLGSPLASIQARVIVPAGTVLQPADCVQFTVPQLGQQLRCRVVSVRYGDYSQRQEVDVELLQDAFRQGFASYTPPPATAPASATPLAQLPAMQCLATIAPYALTGADYNVPVVAWDATAWPDTAGGVGDVANKFLPGVTLAAAWDGDAAQHAQQPVGAAFNTGVPLGWSEVQNPGSLTLAFGGAAAQRMRAAYVKGGGLLYAGGEWLSYSSWTVSGDSCTFSGVKRGLFDSIPLDHRSSTQPLWVLPDGCLWLPEFVALNTNEVGYSYAAATACVLSADAYGARGVRLCEDAGAPRVSLWPADLAVSGRAWRPLPAVRVAVNGVQLRLAAADAPAFARGTLTLQWVNRSRLARSAEGAFEIANAYEAGQKASYYLQVQRDDGSWQTGLTYTSAEGGTSLALDLSGFPSGARLCRVCMRTVRNSGPATELVQYYFRLSN